MDKNQMDCIYDDVVDQIQLHLKRHATTVIAIRLHAEYCEGVIASVAEMKDVRPFVTALIIAFAGKLEFRPHPLFKELLSEASASHLEVIRAAKLVSMPSAVHEAWKHIVALDCESAVVIIALCHKLKSGNKLKKLVSAEQRLEKDLKQEKKQKPTTPESTEEI